MLGFLKKLFGLDKETMKDAGVQLEQAPYKVETPDPIVVTREASIVPVSDSAVIITEKPAAMTAKKKPRGPKNPQGQKPAAKPAAKPATKPQQGKPPARRGRKPKAS
jgi:hypothetical protein